MGPRTSADGSSVINLNKSMDNAAPGPQQVTIIILILPHNHNTILDNTGSQYNLLYAQVRYHPQPVLPALPPLLAQPIKEELGLPAQPSPTILDLTEVSVITALASLYTVHTTLATHEPVLVRLFDLDNVYSFLCSHLAYVHYSLCSFIPPISPFEGPVLNARPWQPAY